MTNLYDIETYRAEGLHLLKTFPLFQEPEKVNSKFYYISLSYLLMGKMFFFLYNFKNEYCRTLELKIVTSIETELVISLIVKSEMFVQMFL